MSIYQFLSTRDPLLTFRWRAFNTEAFDLDARFVERITIPWANFESIPIYVQGSNKYYHSVNDHEPISMSFYVDTNMTAVKALLKWSEKIYKDGRYGLPADYKKAFGAEILDNTSDNAVATFLAEGAWPSAIDAMEFSYNASDRLIVTATITVDQVTFFEGSESAGPEGDASSLYTAPTGSNGGRNVGSGASKGYAA